jgi:hypothetical protein
MSLRAKIPLLCALLVAPALLVPAAPASAHLLLAKDGKIHACYKAKGRGKGTLRVVRNGRVRCPRKWRKVSWYAVAPVTPPAPAGPQGIPGPQGEPGPIDTAAVEALENRVTELLNRVESLETVVGSLCAQTEALLPSFSCPAF